MNFKYNIIKKSFNIRKNKPAFTLIEMIAVIAIIGILAAAILPRVNGYIEEAKKVKVVDQCRKVVMAVESYNLSHNTSLNDTLTVGAAINNKGISKYLQIADLNNLNTGSTSIKNCYDIINGAEFNFSANTEILNPATITINSTNITTSNPT